MRETAGSSSYKKNRFVLPDFGCSNIDVSSRGETVVESPTISYMNHLPLDLLEIHRIGGLVNNSCRGDNWKKILR